MKHEISEQLLSSRARILSDSVIRDIGKKISQRADLISFAGGLPSSRTFPEDKIRAACEQILSQQAELALQYGPTNGYLPLREWIAGSHSRNNMSISPEQVQIVSGSQQALDLVGKVLIDKNDLLAVETPTYIGALQAFGVYQPQFISLDCDEKGLQVECLEKTFAKNKGKLSGLYTIPTFQNPTGRTLDTARRTDLVAEASRLGALLIEDDPYGELDYAGNPHQTLLSLNPEGVVYLGSFSKILTPGLRLGYVIAPLWLAKKN